MTVNELIRSLTTLIEEEGLDVGEYEIAVNVGDRRDFPDYLDVYKDTKVVLLK